MREEITVTSHPLRLVKIGRRSYQAGRRPESPVMGISCSLPTSPLSGRVSNSCSISSPPKSSSLQSEPGNTSPLVPSAGCRHVLPAGKRESVIPQPLNISWMRRATRCTSASEKHALSLFFFHPPNCVWATAVLFNRLHVLSKSKVEAWGTLTALL